MVSGKQLTENVRILKRLNHMVEKGGDGSYS